MQFGKRGAIDAIIQREQAVALLQRLSANEKVCQNAARLTCFVLAALVCVLLKRLSGNSPDRFINGPIDRNTGVFQKLIEEVFAATRKRQQLRKDRAANYEFVARENAASRPLCAAELRLSS